MANRSDTCSFKIKPPILTSQASRHSLSNEPAVIMNGILITDSPNHSLTTHTLLGDAHQVLRILL